MLLLFCISLRKLSIAVNQLIRLVAVQSALPAPMPIAQFNAASAARA
jgi:hypothetical protein